MKRLAILIICAVLPQLIGCSALPTMVGLIPGAPLYLSSLMDGSQSAYETAIDTRDSKQQVRDSLIAGHVKAEFLKAEGVNPMEVTAYCYYGKIYVVGEYDGAEHLEKILACVDKVGGHKKIIKRLYLKSTVPSDKFLENQTISANIKSRLLTDLSVHSSLVDVEVIQREVILLGVINDENERLRIEAHAASVDGVRKVVSFLEHPEAELLVKPDTMLADQDDSVLDQAPDQGAVASASAPAATAPAPTMTASTQPPPPSAKPSEAERPVVVKDNPTKAKSQMAEADPQTTAWDAEQFTLAY